MSSKWYWIIRQKHRNLKFKIKRGFFAIGQRKDASERLASFSKMMLRTLMAQIAINLTLVAALSCGDRLLFSAVQILAEKSNG